MAFVTLDTRPNITLEFDDVGLLIGATEDAIATTLARGLTVWAENQDKNISISRLIGMGIMLDTDDPTLFWEIRNDTVNIIVPAGNAADVVALCPPTITVNAV